VIDQETFKAIMACAPGPATVVTAIGDDGRPQGLTVSAVCSVSLDPPLALACLDLTSNTLETVRSSGAFTVNYLARGCEDVALGFAIKSDTKFDGHPWIAPRDGVGGPILVDASAAYAVCRVQNLIDAGDHVIVVGEVIDGAARDEHHALAYARRRFFTGTERTKP
jgi:flavin reductase (DIM6/NTAB) family NADH-FMN oxidoreductase RutF